MKVMVMLPTYNESKNIGFMINRLLEYGRTKDLDGINELGIVQGRLIQAPKGCLQWFPQEYWENEFFLASALGINFIEFIAERHHNEKNPIWTDEGIKKIKALAQRNRLSIHALCNDYIIDHSLTAKLAVIEQNMELISRAKLLGVNKLILPLFEESELTENNMEMYKDYLSDIGSAAHENNILVCIETNLNGKSLLKLFEILDHPNIKCVFDTGNRIAFGHDIYSDIELLNERIKHVHIKDKNRQNENVLLGTGDVNFNKVFESLSKIGYTGPFTFETTRGNNPLRTAQYNIRFINFFMMETLNNGN